MKVKAEILLSAFHVTAFLGIHGAIEGKLLNGQNNQH